MHILRARHAVVFVALIGLVGCQSGSGGSWWKTNPFKGSTAGTQQASPVKPSSMFAGTPGASSPSAPGTAVASGGAPAANATTSRGGYPGMATSDTAAPPVNGGAATGLPPSGPVNADPMLTPARGYSELPPNYNAGRNPAGPAAAPSAGSYRPASGGPSSQGPSSYGRDGAGLGSGNALRSATPNGSRYDLSSDRYRTSATPADRSTPDRFGATAGLDRSAPSFDRSTGGLDRAAVGTDRSAPPVDRYSSGRMNSNADRFAPGAATSPAYEPSGSRHDATASSGSPYRGTASLDSARTADPYPSAARNGPADRGYDAAPPSYDRGAGPQPDYRSREAAAMPVGSDNRGPAGDYRSNDASYRPAAPAYRSPTNYGPANGGEQQDSGYLPGSATTYPGKSASGSMPSGGSNRSFTDTVTPAAYNQPAMR